MIATPPTGDALNAGCNGTAPEMNPAPMAIGSAGKAAGKGVHSSYAATSEGFWGTFRASRGGVLQTNSADFQQLSISNKNTINITH